MNSITVSLKWFGVRIFITVIILFFTSGIVAQALSLSVELDTAGTLSNKIDLSIKDSVRSLKIIGEVNGADILFIREMAGSDKDGKETSGNLEDLDLSKSHVREGGPYYYLYYPTLDNKIGNYMFYKCKKLVSIILPDDVFSLGSFIFSDCINLESVVISGSIKGFGNQVFNNCLNLNKIIVEDDNEYLSSINGVLFDKNINTLKFYPPAITDTLYNIPATVKTVEAEAFLGNKYLKCLFMPNSITSIGESSFKTCKSLKSVKFSEKLTTIPNNAFIRCIQLRELYLPSSLASIGMSAFSNCDSLRKIYFPHNLKIIEDGAFSSCWSLEIVSLPGSLEKLGRHVFGACYNLKKVVFSSQLESTGSSTFSNCLKLEEVVLSEGISVIGESSFYNCPNLFLINFPESITEIGFNAFKKCTSFIEIELPKNLSKIDIRAFSECTSLEKVHISRNLRYLGYSVFENCLNLMSFEVDTLNEYFCDNEGVLYSRDLSTLVCYPNKKGKVLAIPEFVRHIGDYAFAFSDISEITFTDNVESIERFAFSFCNNLTKIDLNCVVRVGFYAFSNCKNLSEVHMPYLFEIGSGAFSNCIKLENVVISDELFLIDSYLLSGCTGMQKLYIGRSVNMINSSAFARCSSLREIHASNPEPADIKDKSVIEGINLDSCVLYVPTGAKTRYSMANIWNLFKTIKEESSVDVSDVFSDISPEVIAKNGIIKIYNLPKNITAHVYSITGSQIALLSGDSEIKLPENCIYLVKIQDKVYKIKT